MNRPSDSTHGEGPDASETAVLGGGCFWCLEAVFVELRGVRRVLPGYAGGRSAHPSYEEVCAGTTGHAEVVQVSFDAKILPFRDLLDVFFAIHDPTTLNRQGADVGSQYRSIVLYRSEGQREAAEAAIRSKEAELGGRRKVVTELRALDEFYPAEEYHREYFRRNPEKAYCRMVISPKMSKFRAAFRGRLSP